jgi:transposase
VSEAFADDPAQAFPGQGQMKPEQAEIARLKREVTKLKAERDILKKARSGQTRYAKSIERHDRLPDTR